MCESAFFSHKTSRINPYFYGNTEPLIAPLTDIKSGIHSAPGVASKVKNVKQYVLVTLSFYGAGNCRWNLLKFLLLIL